MITLNLAGIKGISALRNMTGVCYSRTASNEISPELQEYLDAVINMTYAVTEITEQNMFVTFNSNPDWYNQDCKDHITALKAHANLWNDSLLPKLISVPQTILNYDTLYKINSKILRDYIGLINSESIPEISKKTIEEGIIQTINTLMKEAEGQQKLVDNIICEITSMKENFNNDNAFAKYLSEKALNQEGENRNKIEKLNKDIKDLRKEIERLRNQYTGGAIGIGVSVTIVGIGVAGMLFAPFMCVVAIMGVGGLIGSIAAMISANKTIADKTSQIMEKRDTMNKAELDAGYCLELSDGCTRVMEALDKAIESLNGISTLWGVLQDSMKQFVEDLKTGSEQAKNKLYNELLDSINQSDSEWNSIVAQAKELTSVEIKTDTTKIHELTVENGCAVVA